MQPKQMWRVEIVLHDVLPIDIVIQYSIAWVRRNVLPRVGKFGGVGLEEVAAP